MSHCFHERHCLISRINTDIISPSSPYLDIKCTRIMIFVLGINKARHEIFSHTYARFHQRRLTLISVQLTLHLFLILRKHYTFTSKIKLRRIKIFTLAKRKSPFYYFFTSVIRRTIKEATHLESSK